MEMKSTSECYVRLIVLGNRRDVFHSKRAVANRFIP